MRKFHRRRRVKRKVGKAVKKYVKKTLDSFVEDKQAGGVIVAFNPLDTMSFVLVNGIAQGTNQGQRVGSSVRSKYLNLRLNFNQNTIARTRMRVMLFWDRQSNGANPTLSQLLTDTTAAQTYYSGINVNGSKRYKILFDRIYDFNVVGGATDAAENKHLQKRFKLKTIVKYNGTGATIADINTNALFLGFCAITTTAMTVSGNADFIYEDA
ncbi:capsid [uncultured virus]|uniref:Capsid n=1 Tax=uncultured virus TaxID=340016 RepID=A0A2K9LT64_9VIRU|nr:capsid [uncultured virus]